jgi:two-component system chemotaxis sensor kinase CheA
MSVDARLLQIFRQEAGERLDAMVSTLLQVEAGAGDPESVRELFRHAHSLKGTAGMVGLEPIAQVARSIEDVLAEARASGELDAAAAEPLLRATDAIRAGMAGEAVDVDAVTARLRAAPTEPEPPPPPPGPAARPDGTDGVAAPDAPVRMATMRVGADRVDELLDAAGEAVLHRRRLEHMLGPTVEHDEHLREELDRGDTLLSDLQHSVLELRTLPLSSIVASFPRTVRDTAARAGREVELELTGVDTQLDRTMLEGISDMIVHLLRNAVSHGIEPPDEREAAGKPRRGTVEVSAEARGNRVEVTVADDGRGVATDLLQRAGTRTELGELLATPGLSTAGAVGELSGRGVGLDAVQRDLKQLGGVLLVTSEPGRGSRFTLRLPATLAVLPLLMVERAGQRFGLPLQTLAEVVSAERIVTLGGRQTVEIDGEVLPVADLAVLLDRVGLRAASGGPVLIIDVTSRRAAVRCDRLLGEQDAVMKALGPLLGALPFYLGATVGDDGTIALVLDARHLLRAAPAAADAGPVTIDEAPARRPPCVLVVDDQFTVRELQRTILASAGYDVLTAGDGREALDALRGGDPVDLVLTDIEMPVLDGFGLLAAVREDPRHASLPVVIVSSRGDEEDKRRGAEAGADAWMVKAEFDQHALLDIVRRLVIA